MSSYTKRERVISEVMSGAVLAENVCDAKGHILIPEGASVTESTLSRLAAHGIRSLVIREQADAPSPEAIEAQRKQIEQRISFIFRSVGNNPPARELERELLKYRLKQVTT